MGKKNSIKTSQKVATKAGKALRASKSTSTKQLAASVLTNTKRNTK